MNHEKEIDAMEEKLNGMKVEEESGSMKVEKLVDFLRDDGNPGDLEPIMSKTEISLSLSPPGKAQQQEIAEKYLISVLDGEVDPLALDANLKAMENIVALIRKDPQFKKLLLEEVQKYPVRQKGFDAFNAYIQISKKTTYKYETSNDPVWDDLKAQKDAIEAKLKARESLLKAIMSQDNSAVMNVETGEIIVDPPECSVSEFLKYTFNP